MGPTNRTASMSQDVNSPASRGVTFDKLREVYYEQARGLVEGGVDLLLLETIFDTLNAKAALFAISQYNDEYFAATGATRSGHGVRHHHRPERAHAFRADGRSVLDFRFAHGPAERGHQLRARREANAPVRRGTFASRARPHQLPPERRPAQRVRRIRRDAGIDVRRPARICVQRLAEYRRRLLRHRRPRTSRRSPKRCADLQPHVLSKPERYTRFSGLEPLVLRPDSRFVNIGERTNVTGSPKFSKLILAGEFEAALSVARQQVENGAQIIDINMDEAMLDSEQAMTTFLHHIAAEPDIARVPIMIDSSNWKIIEAGLKCIQGRGIVNSISLKEGEEAFRAARAAGPALRRGHGRDGVR